jgi:hypothetical protein
MTDRTYGTHLPGLPPGDLGGKQVVIEGADGSGRSCSRSIWRSRDTPSSTPDSDVPRS